MLSLSNVNFIHIPKTGGSWVIKALKNYAQDAITELDNKPHPRCTDFKNDKPFFAFIRNPWDWYVSSYYYNKNLYEKRIGGFVGSEENWHPEQKIMEQAVKGSFSEYLRIANEKEDEKPRTLSGCLKIFCDKPNVKFFKYETLSDSLIEALDFFNEDIDIFWKEKIKTFRKINVTTNRPKYTEVYSLEDRRYVEKIDQDIIREWGYRYEHN